MDARLRQQSKPKDDVQILQLNECITQLAEKQNDEFELLHKKQAAIHKMLIEFQSSLQALRKKEK